MALWEGPGPDCLLGQLNRTRTRVPLLEQQAKRLLGAGRAGLPWNQINRSN